MVIGGSSAHAAATRRCAEPKHGRLGRASGRCLQRIRVVLAYRERLLREGLRQLLQDAPDLDVCEEATTPRELLHAMVHAAPDVVLCDLRLLAAEPTVSVAHLALLRPAAPILLLADTCERTVVSRTLWEGARGYLLTTSSGSDLCKAIRALSAGEVWVGRQIVRWLLEDGPRQAWEPTPGVSREAPTRLSRREAEVAHHAVLGYSNQAIATQLFISEKTVKSHLASVFKKLGVPNRLHLALHLLGQGTLDTASGATPIALRHLRPNVCTRLPLHRFVSWQVCPAVTSPEGSYCQDSAISPY